MRILHVINLGTTCGGAERQLAELAQAQRAAGHDVVVLASDRHRDVVEVLPLPLGELTAPADTRPRESDDTPAARPPALAACGRRQGCVRPATRSTTSIALTSFDCIANFWNGQGHMEERQDQTYSTSGGRPGSRSHHGGTLRPVYRGP